jgi:hypothetical protein
MGNKDWVKAIAKKRREDVGDWPTLPEEMLELLRRLGDEKGDGRKRASSLKLLTDLERKNIVY